MIQRTVTLPGGRRIQTYEAGDPTGELVIVHNGTPAPGLLPRIWAGDAVRRGIRLVGYDRPGYGRSERAAGRVVSDAAADVAAIADSLSVDRFRTWGGSGGGPHALACAALLPDRVIAAAVVGSVAPFKAEGLNFFNGMGELNVKEFGAGMVGEEVLRPRMEADRRKHLAADPATPNNDMESILPPADLAVLTGEVGDMMLCWTNAALSSGVDGWCDDTAAILDDWGFDLSSIRVPTLVLHGRQDLAVPVAHGRWLAGHIATATGVFLDEGHLSLVPRVGDDVHAWLMQQH